MGSWSSNPLENDDAMDFIGEIVEPWLENLIDSEIVSMLRTKNYERFRAGCVVLGKLGGICLSEKLEKQTVLVISFLLQLQEWQQNPPDDNYKVHLDTDEYLREIEKQINELDNNLPKKFVYDRTLNVYQNLENLRELSR
jgi:hypothetical protein